VKQLTRATSYAQPNRKSNAEDHSS